MSIFFLFHSDVEVTLHSGNNSSAPAWSASRYRIFLSCLFKTFKTAINAFIQTLPLITLSSIPCSLHFWLFTRFATQPRFGTILANCFWLELETVATPGSTSVEFTVGKWSTLWNLGPVLEDKTECTLIRELLRTPRLATGLLSVVFLSWVGVGETRLFFLVERRRHGLRVVRLLPCILWYGKVIMLIGGTL